MAFNHFLTLDLYVRAVIIITKNMLFKHICIINAFVIYHLNDNKNNNLTVILYTKK